ncbi:MAG: hypothetical protein ACTIJ6_11500 [Leucobacter sp.]
MDLKFSFGGASPDQHDHGGAPSGIPLPFAGAASVPLSMSSQLDVVVRLDSASSTPVVVAEVLSGDAVSYSQSEVQADLEDTAAFAKAVRSAISRAVAGLDGPLAGAVSSIELQLTQGSEVLVELGLPSESPTVDEALQARIGVPTGTPIRVVG